ncbi:MAG: glycosyltransferase family 2 protein [Pseudomonadota bacterium]|nr:glycosyltransferase family 2 protein [Pseudomonadota bacterium]
MVSIVIPVFNASKYLEKCVSSAVNQTYSQIEILLVNDGSTDGSKELCNGLAQENENIIVFHTPNRGVSSARNTALKNCSGEFVAFLDADDTLNVDAVQSMIDGCQNTLADIVVGSFNKVTPEGKILQTVRDSNEDILHTMKGVVDYTLNYLRNPRKNQLLMGCWAKLFKVSIIKNNRIWFDLNLDLGEDVKFNFDYLKHIERALFLEKVVYNHQKTSEYNSLSMKLPDNPSKFFSSGDLLPSFEGFILNYDRSMDIKRELGCYYIYHTVLFMIRLSGQVNCGNLGTARKCIKNLFNEQQFRDHINDYMPAEGNYRLIPFIMKYRLVWVLIALCRREAKNIFLDS